MTVLLIIILILLLLICVFFMTPLQFGIVLKKSAHVNKSVLYFNCLGVPVRIPIKKQTKLENKKQKKLQKKESPITFENFKENIDDFKEIYSTSKSELSEMLSYVRRHLTVQNVDFEIRFGFDNAAITGISTGAIWTMGSFILKAIDSLVGIKKINMQVNPDFNNKVFEVSSKFILIMRPIHFIIVLRKVIKTYSYVKNKINNIKGGAQYGRTSY